MRRSQNFRENTETNKRQKSQKTKCNSRRAKGPEIYKNETVAWNRSYGLRQTTKISLILRKSKVSAV